MYYGDKPHSDPEEAFAELRDVIQHPWHAAARSSSRLFVGRTQEIVFT
jgi:hypothetical protein